MKIKRLLALLIAALLALPAYASPDLQALWEEALEVGGGKARWKDARPTVWWQPPRFVVVRIISHRLYGEYLAPQRKLRKDGTYILEPERINLYMEPHEAIWLREWILHEFLHAVWLRRADCSARFKKKNPDSEVWVRTLLNQPLP